MPVSRVGPRRGRGDWAGAFPLQRGRRHRRLTFDPPGAGVFKEDPTEAYHNYAMKWDPNGVDYYMDDAFMQRFTTDQVRNESTTYAGTRVRG